MTREELTRRVSVCAHATMVANAFRRALGLPLKLAAPKTPAIVSVDAYADLEWCMANHGSPLDGRI